MATSNMAVGLLVGSLVGLAALKYAQNRSMTKRDPDAHRRHVNNALVKREAIIAGECQLNGDDNACAEYILYHDGNTQVQQPIAP